MSLTKRNDRYRHKGKQSSKRKKRFVRPDATHKANRLAEMSRDADLRQQYHQIRMRELPPKKSGVVDMDEFGRLINQLVRDIHAKTD